MAEFVSPFSDLGKKPVTVHGEMQCFTCYEIVDTGVYDKTKRTLVYMCSHGHRNTMEDYKL